MDPERGLELLAGGSDHHKAEPHRHPAKNLRGLSILERG
jgi:hypothetical protein